MVERNAPHEVRARALEFGVTLLRSVRARVTLLLDATRELELGDAREELAEARLGGQERVEIATLEARQPAFLERLEPDPGRLLLHVGVVGPDVPALALEAEVDLARAHAAEDAQQPALEVAEPVDRLALAEQPLALRDRDETHAPLHLAPRLGRDRREGLERRAHAGELGRRKHAGIDGGREPPDAQATLPTMRAWAARALFGLALAAVALVLWLGQERERGSNRAPLESPTAPREEAPAADPAPEEPASLREAREVLVDEVPHAKPRASDALAGVPLEQLFLGRVLDGTTGQPLAGVEVHWRQRNLPAPLPGEREPETTSDVEGEFRLKRSGDSAWLVAPGCAPLAFVARPAPSPRTHEMVPFPGNQTGRASASESGRAELPRFEGVPVDPEPEVDPGRVHDFELLPAASLELFLVGPYDAPCRWMRVELVEVPSAPEPGSTEISAARLEGRLDDEQRVRFPVVRANVPHRILLGGREHAAAVEVAPGEARTELLRCAFVELLGTVTDPSGRALENARVEAGGLRVQTDASGGFAFMSLAPGPHLIAVRSDDGFWALHEPIELAAEPLHVTLHLEPAAALEGRVQEADGRPATGRIWLQRRGEPRARIEVALDENGAFVVPALEQVEFELGHVEIAGTLRQVRPGQGAIELQLPARAGEPSAAPHEIGY